MDGILFMKILYGLGIAFFLGSIIYFGKVIEITSTMEDKSKKA